MNQFRVLYDDTDFFHFYPVGTVVELLPNGDVTEEDIGTCREYVNAEALGDTPVGTLIQFLPDSFVEEIKG